MKRIAHLTSAHPRFDVRIFHKQCTSLAGAGYDVSLVVADGRGDERTNGVAVLDVGASRGRLDRIRNAPTRVLRRALELEADLYHLHDPELIPIGLKLKRIGAKVIFDAHEDVPRQMLGKPYLNRVGRLILARSFESYERWACRKLDGVVAATAYIRDRYRAMGIPTVDVNNYPLADELTACAVDWAQKQRQVCYVGGMARVRGIREIVQAMEFTGEGTRLAMGGSFSSVDFALEVKSERGWSQVRELGWLSRDGVGAVMSESVAGLVTLHPIINYLDALPVKMFEYMAAGIPVIASDFPLWRSIISESDCGVCVDPLDPESIAAAIRFLVDNPQDAERMGRNGRRAVHERYNWDIEERKLLEFYAAMDNDNRAAVLDAAG